MQLMGVAARPRPPLLPLYTARLQLHSGCHNSRVATINSRPEVAFPAGSCFARALVGQRMLLTVSLVR